MRAFLHTDVGNTLVWAKVNGNIVRVDHVLQNGNVVEIMCHPAITMKSIRRHKHWLSIAKTKLALLLIQKFLKENTSLCDDSKNEMSVGADAILAENDTGDSKSGIHIMINALGQSRSFPLFFPLKTHT